MSNTSKADTSNKQMQSQTKKPFCKVCFDAGKTIAEYSTHYVRDRPGGVVVCPTMLKQQCKYCKKNGHTPKHCPELEGKYQQPAKHEQSAKHEQPVKHEAYSKPSSLLPVPIIENKNNFKSLALNDGFPVVGEKDSGKIIRPAPVKLNAWASVVAKGPQKTAQAKQPEEAQAKQPEEAQAEQQAEQQAKQPEEAQAKQPEEAQAEQQAKQPEEAQAEQPEEEQPQAPAEQKQPQADEYIPQDYSKCSWADY